MTDAKSVLKFKNGKLSPAAAPKWFQQIDQDGDWHKLLEKAGAKAMDEVGDGGDTIHIWYAPDDGYLIEFWDVNEPLCHVFIDNVADYLTFRAQYIAPLAQLILASDRHSVWQEDQKKKRR